MTVVYKQNHRKFNPEEVLWAKRELVEAVVRQAVLNQTEGFIEMIMDGERSEDITRANVNNTLRGVPDSAHDFLRDVLSDLEREIMRCAKEVQYGAAVTGIKYDLAGEVKDIEVDVTVTFEDAEKPFG